jgi:hypothetical protein
MANDESIEAADLGVNAKSGEVIGRDQMSPDSLIVSVEIDTKRDGRDVSGGIGEQVPAQAVALIGEVGDRPFDGDEFGRARCPGQRPQDHAVHFAEGAGGDGDTEAERDDRDGGESWRSSEAAQAVAEVAAELLGVLGDEAEGCIGDEARLTDGGGGFGGELVHLVAVLIAEFFGEGAGERAVGGGRGGGRAHGRGAEVGRFAESQIGDHGPGVLIYERCLAPAVAASSSRPDPHCGEQRRKHDKHSRHQRDCGHQAGEHRHQHRHSQQPGAELQDQRSLARNIRTGERKLLPAVKQELEYCH